MIKIVIFFGNLPGIGRKVGGTRTPVLKSGSEIKMIRSSQNHRNFFLKTV